MRRSHAFACAALVLPALLCNPMVAEAQDWAKARLEASPRHHEYIAIDLGGRTLQAFVAYPEISRKAPVVILIHEIFGLSDWAKEMADELAEAGYIVIAPDLLTGSGPRGKAGLDPFPGQDETTRAVSALDPAGVLSDLDHVADYAKKLPAANGKLDVVGFCWGGSKTFAFAAHRHDLAAAFVFYGSGPDDVTAVTAPVYGFYAGNDARIGATLSATTAAMKAAGKRFDPVTYEGAGHGFMRAGEDPNALPANKQARDDAFARLTTLLAQANGGPVNATPHAAARKRSLEKEAAPVCHEAAGTM